MSPWQSGSWDLALVVFAASSVVPLAKLIALTFLLVSVERRWRGAPRQRAKVYRAVEIVRTWSMLDIYVVAPLATAVHFSALAEIQAAPGAIAFGAVVVITMSAAQAIDPRLIRDRAEPQHGRRTP